MGDINKLIKEKYYSKYYSIKKIINIAPYINYLFIKKYYKEITKTNKFFKMNNKNIYFYL